jgi:hypothetical protein
MLISILHPQIRPLSPPEKDIQIHILRVERLGDVLFHLPPLLLILFFSLHFRKRNER